ncbi:MAG: dihydroneopterin aldolase [Epsilonproteobacteria bacterium]|nr:dihydroneopterin aldolase [Campylobacterota bacterium]
MLKVTIENLTFECIIGILESERKDEQKVIINLSFEYFFNENTKEFIDYSKVAFLVENIMKEEKFFLIEDAILFLRKKLKIQYELKNLWLKITKPDIMPNCIVSVEE